MEKNADSTSGRPAMEVPGYEETETHRDILSLLLTFVLCSLLFSFILLTRQSQASDIFSQQGSKAKGTSKISAKAKLSFGYDNNVSERREDRLESQFYQFYISSGMYMFPSERTVLSLKLQDGLKYLDAQSLSGESVLINNINLSLSHKLSERFMPEIQCEVRGRTSIHRESDVLPSEEAYLRGSVGVALRAVIQSDVTGRAFLHYKFTNFEDFDPFDRQGALIGLRTDIRLLPGSTMSLQYSRAETDFRKWEPISTDGKTSRADTLHDLSIYAQFYGFFLFDITYSYQNNTSDIDGYSYRANKLALLMAKSLPRDFMFQLYALLRSKKYQSAPGESVSEQVELEDDERGLLMVKLSKDVSEDCALEAQYDLRRSSSYEEDGLYTKGVLSLSLSVHF